MGRTRFSTFEPTRVSVLLSISRGLTPHAATNDTFSRFWRATGPAGRSGWAVAYFRAIHSVVSLSRMKWTTELGKPNEQNSRKHWVEIEVLRCSRIRENSGSRSACVRILTNPATTQLKASGGCQSPDVAVKTPRIRARTYPVRQSDFLSPRSTEPRSEGA